MGQENGLENIHQQNIDTVSVVDSCKVFVPVCGLNNNRSRSNCRGEVRSEGSPSHGEKN